MAPIVKISDHYIEPHEAALFFLAVDNIERVEDRLHSGIGTPERDAKSQQKAEGQIAVALCGNARDLVAHEIERAGWNDVGQDRKMLADRSGIRKQRIRRHARSNTGEQGKQ
jgi:hypothetical protein